MIHIGGDIIVHRNEVIGIFKYNYKKENEIIKEFLSISEDEGFVTYLCEKEKGKSFIITNNKVYISPISSLTLKKREENINFL